MGDSEEWERQRRGTRFSSTLSFIGIFHSIVSDLARQTRSHPSDPVDPPPPKRIVSVGLRGYSAGFAHSRHMGKLSPRVGPSVDRGHSGFTRSGRF